MVAATKSLFMALGKETPPLEMISKMSRALKEMGFQNMYMGLTAMRLHQNRLSLVSAGMPFPLIYRAATNEVQEIEARGMPLGSFPDYPYKTMRMELHPGDKLLLMSDGLIECFDPQDRMIGQKRTRELFLQAAEHNAANIIKFLAAEASSWAAGRPLEDDMTLVVLEVMPRLP